MSLNVTVKDFLTLKRLNFSWSSWKSTILSRLSIFINFKIFSHSLETMLLQSIMKLNNADLVRISSKLLLLHSIHFFMKTEVSNLIKIMNFADFEEGKIRMKDAIKMSNMIKINKIKFSKMIKNQDTTTFYSALSVINLIIEWKTASGSRRCKSSMTIIKNNNQISWSSLIFSFNQISFNISQQSSQMWVAWITMLILLIIY